MLEFLIDNVFVGFKGYIFARPTEQIIPLASPMFPFLPIRQGVYKKSIKDKIITEANPLISLSGILMMLCQIIIQTLQTGFH